MSVHSDLVPPFVHVPAKVAAARAVDAVKIYGTGDAAVRALNGLTVEFERGHFTAIMGPSGSGKSTLLHCLAGLDALSAGQIFLGDIELGRLSERDLTRLRRDRAGFVFQAFNLIPTLSAAENVTLPMDLAGRDPDPAWLDTVIDAVGIRDRLSHKPSELSGGQQQRAAAARALASRPEIVFADEPTGNLDSRAAAELLSFMQRAVKEFEQTIVMVTTTRRRVASGPRRLPRRRPHRRRDARAERHADPRPDEAPGGLSTVWRATLKGLLAHRWRLLRTALAVALGVGFVAGTYILTDTMRQKIDDIIAEGTEGQDVVVRAETKFADVASMGVEAPVYEGLLPVIESIDGVADASGSAFGTAVMIDEQGDPIQPMGPPTLGGNWDETQFDMVEGRPPTGLTDVVVDDVTAESHGFAVRDDIRIVFQDSSEEFQIVGIVKLPASYMGATMALFDLPVAGGCRARGASTRSQCRPSPACRISSCGPRGHGASGGLRGRDDRVGDGRCEGPARLVMGFVETALPPRRRGPVRRGVHHLQHLLDPRRAADARDRAAASRRGHASPGDALRAR
jgi:ABC-type lipoprotein export system ATPase subunit